MIPPLRYCFLAQFFSVEGDDFVSEAFDGWDDCITMARLIIHAEQAFVAGWVQHVLVPFRGRVYGLNRHHRRAYFVHVHSQD